MSVTLGLLATFGHAAESSAPNADFLEYLAEFDSGDDDWTWFATDDTDGKNDERRATQPPQQQEKAKP